MPAIKNYEKAIQYNPDFPYAYKNLAKIYLEKAPNLKLAAENYEKYLELNPNDPEKETIENILRQIQK
jgi:tetratricopeptide (TPR) repeat protein